MAKAGFWLRGAKGKLAGAVAQKGEKGTVLRENVVPANPRTTAQMTHRVIFGTVTSAAKHMLPIIGQSFEGVPNFKENRREFIRKNLQELIVANQENNSQPNCATKGISTIIANNYILSHGSLSLNWKLVPDSGYYNLKCANAGLQSNDTYSANVFMKEMFDVEPGDQLTFVAIITKENYLYGDKNIYRGAIPEMKLYAGRIVFKDDFGSTEFTLAQDAPAYQTLKDKILTLCNEEKTDSDFADLFLDISDEYTNSMLKPRLWDWELTQTAFVPVNGNFMIGFAMFKSKFDNGEWKYSTSKLTCLDSAMGDDDNLEITLGVTPQEAIKSYYQKYSSSDWFTRQGGDINSI